MIRPRHDSPVRTFGVSVMITCLAFLLAGIAWPQAAEALLRLLFVTLAAGFVVARAYEAMVPLRTTREFSPFDGDTAARTPPATPRVLRDLTAELGAADDDRLAHRTPIPWPVRWTLIEEATRRLADHHGLSLHDPVHHSDIRTLVSEPTWLLIGPRAPAPGPGARPTPDKPTVPLSRLGPILDDLERL